VQRYQFITVAVPTGSHLWCDHCFKTRQTSLAAYSSTKFFYTTATFTPTKGILSLLDIEAKVDFAQVLIQYSVKAIGRLNGEWQARFGWG